MAMQVTLLNADSLDDAMTNAAFAALVCTGREEHLSSKARVLDILRRLIDKDHMSVLEHVNFTFHVENISRALLQELARHRHLSLSVRSTRTALRKQLSTKEGRKAIIDAARDIMLQACNSLPESAANTDINAHNSKTLMEAETNILHGLVKILHMCPDSPTFAPDYVKYLLPECMPTSLVMTVNMRELLHIFNLRSVHVALREFRRLTAELFLAIPPDYRELFSFAFDPDALRLLDDDDDGGDVDDGKEED